MILFAIFGILLISLLTIALNPLSKSHRAIMFTIAGAFLMILSEFEFEAIILG